MLRVCNQARWTHTRKLHFTASARWEIKSALHWKSKSIAFHLIIRVWTWGEAIEIEFARFQNSIWARERKSAASLESHSPIIVKIVSKINLMYVIWNWIDSHYPSLFGNGEEKNCTMLMSFQRSSILLIIVRKANCEVSSLLPETSDSITWCMRYRL